jgi:hypothetical protein
VHAEAISILPHEIASSAFGLLAMTLLTIVIASEAKQSRAARDCFGGLRPPRNDSVGSGQAGNDAEDQLARVNE